MHNRQLYYDDLKKELLKDHGHLIGGEYVQELNLNQSEYNSTSFIFESITFEEIVKFKDLNINCGIKFINCTFKKEVIFIGCTAHGYDERFKYEHFNLCFSKCNGSILYILSNNRFERDIKIINKSAFSKVEIQNFDSESGSIYIEDSEIKSSLNISSTNIKNDLRIHNSKINALIRYSDIKSNSISFTKSEFERDIFIAVCRVGNLIFNEGIYKEEVQIEGVQIGYNFTVSGDEFKKNIEIRIYCESNEISGSLNTVNIIDGIFHSSFIINGFNKTIDKVDLNTSSIKGKFLFKNSLIKLTKIYGENQSANVSFSHCQFNKLIIDNFLNYGNINLSSCGTFEKNSEISILFSNLGKTYFFNINLTLFDKIRIVDSMIDDIISSGVRWFDDRRLITVDKDEINDGLYRRREIYRQLKFASEKQGDRIQALEFKSRELNAYRSELKRISSKKRGSTLDKINLWFSQSNDFGQNWWKPIWIIILITIGFYLTMVPIGSNELQFIPAQSFDDISLTFKVYCNQLFVLPQLFNPARAVEKVFPIDFNFSFWFYLLDIFQRILLAIFIFQIVSAFRKFVK